MIKETSKIEIWVDGKLLDYNPHSTIDAFERVVNEIKKEAKIVETIKITKE